MPRKPNTAKTESKVETTNTVPSNSQATKPVGDAELNKAANTPNKGMPDLSKYAHLPTTSAKIRAMASDGFSKGDIARSGLTTKEGNPIRYQHVRNVLNTPVMHPTEVTQPPASTEKEAGKNKAA